MVELLFCSCNGCVWSNKLGCILKYCICKKPWHFNRSRTVVIGKAPTTFFNCRTFWPRLTGHFPLLSPGTDEAFLSIVVVSWTWILMNAHVQWCLCRYVGDGSHIGSCQSSVSSLTSNFLLLISQKLQHTVIRPENLIPSLLICRWVSISWYAGSYSVLLHSTTSLHTCKSTFQGPHRQIYRYRWTSAEPGKL